jgi:2-oxoglutarate ferredoxin oxidoreductase subunit alpha
MKELLKGNEAMAEAAVRAGMELYVGYPITPQSDIMEYLSFRMPDLGKVFIQSESEIISINTALGGSLTGARCMTSSSGVGISLMQEGFTACFAKGLTTLIINVNRSGCGMGNNFAGGQDDYLRCTRGGGNGDYRLLVYIPSSIQEAVNLIYDAWEVAEKYRNPVMLFTEGRLGQMMEAVELPEFKTAPRPKWGLDGTTKLMKDFGPLQPENTPKYRAKLLKMAANEQRWEQFMVDDAEILLVAVGLCSRVCKEVVNKMRADGNKIGLLRPISAWPFPFNGFAQLPTTIKKLICVEVSNYGQLIEDVLIAAKKVKSLNNVPVYNYYDYELMSSESIENYISKVCGNEVQEVG